MTKAKLLSLCLAAVLLCGCIVGFMVTGASAEGGTVWTVDGVGTETDSYEDLQAALDAAVEANWAETDELTIKITAETAQTVSRSEDGIIFSIPTIWRGVGKKLPITIDGGTLDFSACQAQKNAFTNDYTFKNLTASKTLGTGTGPNSTRFYAGSGAVKFDEVAGMATYRIQFWADNFTEAAYIGWTEEDLDAIKAANNGLVPSSMEFLMPSYTLKTNLVIGAVGWSPEVAPTTAREAADVWFEMATTGTVDVVVQPSDCKAKMIAHFNKEAATTWAAVSGTSPVAEAELEILDGSLAKAGVCSAGTTFAKKIIFTVNDGEFTDFNSTSGTVNGDIYVNINGGTFNETGDDVAFKNGTNTGDFVLTITGGTFTKNAYFARGAVGGTMMTTITGGTFEKGIMISPYTTTCPKIENYISGGTFKGAAYLGGITYTTSQKESSPDRIGTLTNYISGGTFEKAVFVQWRGAIETATTYISGDTKISGNFYAGSAGQGSTLTRIGTSTVHVFGGRFASSLLNDGDNDYLKSDSLVYNIYRNETDLPGNALEIAKKMFGETKIVEEGAEPVPVEAEDLLTELVIDGRVQAGPDAADAVNVYAGDENYKIVTGTGTAYHLTTADKATVNGKLYLEKTGNWTKDKVYLAVNKTQEYDFDLNKRTVYGYGYEVEEGDVKKVVAAPGLAPEFANLELKEKISIVLYFNAADVAKFWNDAANSYNNFVANLGADAEPVYATTDPTNEASMFTDNNKVTIEEVEYYKVTITGITPADLTKVIALDGRTVTGTVTLNEILDATIAHAGEDQDLIDTCNAIKAIGGQGQVTADAIDMTGASESKAAGATTFKAQNLGVIMGDAVGFSIYGEAGAGEVEVYVNGEKTECFAVSTVTFEGTEYSCIDIFVAVDAADEIMTFEVKAVGAEEAEYTLTASVLQIANLYSAQHPDYNTVQAIAAYIQSANAYAA